MIISVKIFVQNRPLGLALVLVVMRSKLFHTNQRSQARNWTRVAAAVSRSLLTASDPTVVFGPMTEREVWWEGGLHEAFAVHSPLHHLEVYRGR
jgi:hypothetical protein